ncbi:MAG: 30S ribosomal protein S13 [Candidatus Pacearchaeota archaeon]
MAEEKTEKQIQKKEPKLDFKLKQQKEEEFLESLVRIHGKDIPGNKKIYPGLTYIKGVSWAVSNAICRILKFNKNIKISELSKKQIEEIEAFLQKPTMYDYMKNRQRDYDTGESKHLLTNELDMVKDFDIKRMRQIKSYKGMRHALKQPVRGQRTRSHFRTTGVAVGVKKKAK